MSLQSGSDEGKKGTQPASVHHAPILPASAAKAEARRATTCPSPPKKLKNMYLMRFAMTSNTKMFRATPAVQVSCQGQMDLHRIQSIPYPVPSPLPPLLFTAHDARCGVSRKCNLLSLALSDSSLPTPLKPSLSLLPHAGCASLSALHFQRSSDLKMKLDAPPSNWICTGEKI